MYGDRQAVREKQLAADVIDSLAARIRGAPPGHNPKAAAKRAARGDLNSMTYDALPKSPLLRSLLTALQKTLPVTVLRVADSEGEDGVGKRVAIVCARRNANQNSAIGAALHMPRLGSGDVSSYSHSLFRSTV